MNEIDCLLMRTGQTGQTSPHPVVMPGLQDGYEVVAAQTYCTTAS